MDYKAITGPDDPRIKIVLDVEGEDIPVRGNAMVSGDDGLDRQVEDEILQRVEQGDEWAWCHVKVTIYASCVRMVECGMAITVDTWANDNLGCCSYMDEDEFKAGGYYEDMVKTCIDAINGRLAGISNLLEFAP